MTRGVKDIPFFFFFLDLFLFGGPGDSTFVYIRPQRIALRNFRVSYPRGAEGLAITYSRGLCNHDGFQAPQVGTHALESAIRPFRVPSIPLEGRPLRRIWVVMQVQDLPCKLSFCTGNGCSPKKMGISVTGRALTEGAQIELRSFTSESWTEPRKWKSFLNVHKKNILRSSLPTYPTGIVHTQRQWLRRFFYYSWEAGR